MPKPTLTDYRAYRLNRDRKIDGPALIIQQESDEKVIESFKQRIELVGYTVEIWDGSRLVCTIETSSKS